ncbi:MAG: HAMP domain-containing protein [Oxalobacter sp.]|nr:MAG: HAMP domain-containing protein [Oxalobacter sp.]
MNTVPKKLTWLKSGLFWRTFFMLGFLVTVSMAAWFASLRMVERAPIAQQNAAQVISIVTITRAALTHSDPELRQELLFDLMSNEGLRIYPLEATDKIEPPPDDDLVKTMHEIVRSKLGANTKFARMVNDTPGFWVSFKLAEDDEYWLVLERKRMQRISGMQLLGWLIAMLVVSLLMAAIISGLVSQPLTQLALASRRLAKGQQPDPLPESGTSEVAEANRSFNQMVEDLNRIESDRAVILAGISHDLRTPLTRLQLEIEMANLSEAEKNGIHSDIQQMDAIIGQFLDYARPADPMAYTTPVDVTVILREAIREAERRPDVRVMPNIQEGVSVMGNATDLRRVINNLLENAHRYGRTPTTGMCEIDASCILQNNVAIIEISDRGVGVPDEEKAHLLRPFTRLDTARSQANGAGLGLAIVDRIIKRHGGTLELLDRDRSRKTGGLTVKITLPAQRRT